MPSVIESKVYAATLGSGAGAIVGSFLLWVLGVTLWHASSDAGQSVAAVSSVPAPVSGVVGLVLTVGGAFAAGYRAPHTDRPDVAPIAVPAPAAESAPARTGSTALTDAPAPVEPAPAVEATPAP